jgi:DNA invertase Pin-like site-specific DNA recombinase
MKVGIYCRVSTRDKGQDTANQRLQLERFARKQGWKVQKVYEDRVSGKRGEREREAFKQMFEAAARREWDCLLFWSLDRFSREGAFPTLRYLTRLSELGVSYRSYTEEYINSTGIFGDVIVSLLATLAKQETIRLSERTSTATGTRFSSCVPLVRASAKSPENWGSARRQSTGS